MHRKNGRADEKGRKKMLKRCLDFLNGIGDNGNLCRLIKKMLIRRFIQFKLKLPSVIVGKAMVFKR